MTIVEALVRVGAGLVSLPLFYVAWFVYEDEEKTLQSKIEEWWLQFDDLRERMLTRQNAFVSVVAARAREPLDRLLGDGRISEGTIAVSWCLSVGSIFGFSELALLGTFRAHIYPHIHTLLVGEGLVGVICLLAGIAPAIAPRYIWIPKVVPFGFSRTLSDHVRPPKGSHPTDPRRIAPLGSAENVNNRP